MGKIGGTRVNVIPKILWTVTATADNASTTVTKAGVAGFKHYVTNIMASFSAAAIKLMTIKYEGVLSGNVYVHNQIVSPCFLRGGLDQDIEVQLAASGTGGVFGTVTIQGFTE